MTPLIWVMTSFLKGHENSRYPEKKERERHTHLPKQALLWAGRKPLNGLPGANIPISSHDSGRHRHHSITGTAPTNPRDHLLPVIHGVTASRHDNDDSSDPPGGKKNMNINHVPPYTTGSDLRCDCISWGSNTKPA